MVTKIGFSPYTVHQSLQQNAEPFFLIFVLVQTLFLEHYIFNAKRVVEFLSQLLFLDSAN